MSDEADSDYMLNPKPTKKVTVGLKAPSSARTQAQHIIRSEKENSEAAKMLLLLTTNDDE